MKKKITEHPAGPWDRGLSVLSLASRIPIRQGFRFDPRALDFWLPLVGFPAMLAALLGFWGGMRLFRDPFIAAASGLVIQYLSFNLFHFDGLLDSADAFLGYGDRERRLAILKDPHLGVYALFTGVVYLLLKIGFLCRLLPHLAQYAPLILAYPLSGRAAAALIPRLLPPARSDGLGALVRGGSAWRTVLGGTAGWALTGVTLEALGPLLGFFGQPADPGAYFGWSRLPVVALSGGTILASVLLATPLVAWGYRKGIGGYSGDALGAAVELGELFHLAFASIVLRGMLF